MKHLKFLSCMLLAVVCVSLPSISHAQWVRSGYVVIQDATVIHSSGSGGYVLVGNGLAQVQAYYNGTAAGEADVTATFEVTWTWPGYGPSTGFSTTPSGVVGGYASTALAGFAASGVELPSTSGSRNTILPGNPYNDTIPDAVINVPPGLFTYSADLTAIATANQMGATVSSSACTRKIAKYAPDAAPSTFAITQVIFSQ